MSSDLVHRRREYSTAAPVYGNSGFQTSSGRQGPPNPRRDHGVGARNKASAITSVPMRLADVVVLNR